MSNDNKSHNQTSGKEVFIICFSSILFASFIIVLVVINTWISHLLLFGIFLSAFIGAYYIYKKVSFDAEKSIENEIQTDDQAMPRIQQPNEYFIQYQKLTSNYQHLQNTSQQHLSKNAQNKLKNIEEIMQLMSEKLEHSQDQSFQHEIMDIQRTLNAYLSPALQHFIDIPKFLRDRQVLDHQQTPNQIIEQQLQMIVDEFQNIAESIYLNDLNQLVDHGQFLKYKLQQPELFKIQQDPPEN